MSAPMRTGVGTESMGCGFAAAAWTRVSVTTTCDLKRHRMKTEMSMPAAAIAKAGWKPQRDFTNSAASGARKAPTLMPI